MIANLHALTRLSLCMKIKQLTLTNFRCFDALSLSFDERLTLLIARNGAGKSTVLDALAIALGAFLTRLPGVSGLNPKKTDFLVNTVGDKPAYMRIHCQTEDGLCWDKTEKRDQSKKTLQQIPTGIGLKQLNAYVDSWINAYNDKQAFELPVFIYYGTGRGVFSVPQRKRSFAQTFPRFDTFKDALESRTNFKRFVEYFYFLEDQENRLQKQQRSFDVELPELRAIRLAISHMMPGFSSPRSSSPAGIIVDWHKSETETTELRIEQLSDGYRTTLAMVMDIASRMAEANPEKTAPLEGKGVVLIDEVDLHLHPSWQREFLPRLQQTFPQLQFIVSTHSPFIIQSVKEAKLIDLDNTLSAPSHSLTPERSLEDIAEEIMGLEGVQRSAIFQKQVETAQSYYRLLDEGAGYDDEQIQALEQQLDELETYFGDNPAYVAFLKAERRKRLHKPL